MVKSAQVLALFLALLFCGFARADVLKVDGNKVVIRLNGKKVALGEFLDVIDSNGHKSGLIKVTGLDEGKAYAEIQSGVVAVGMRLARRPMVKVERAESKAPPLNYDARVNPLGLIGGGLNANFDFRIFEDWTFGIQGAYLHVSLSPSGIFTSDYNISAWGLGARANWFFNGALKSGFYLGPALEYLAVTLKTSDAYGAASGKAAGMMASCLIGYGWFAEGFNLMVGLGYGTVLGASGITITDSVGNKSTIVANLSGITYELSAGYAF